MALSFLRSEAAKSTKDESMQETKDKKKEKDTSKKPSSKKKSSSASKKTDTKDKSAAKKKKDDKLHGPITKVYYSQEIRLFNKSSTWYYTLDDVLAVGGVNYSKKFIDGFKDNDEYDEYFADGIKKYPAGKDKDENLDCINKDTVIKLVRKSDISFPGSFVRWVETADKQLYKKPSTKKPKKEEVDDRPFNPSEGG